MGVACTHLPRTGGGSFGGAFPVASMRIPRGGAFAGGPVESLPITGGPLMLGGGALIGTAALEVACAGFTMGGPLPSVLRTGGGGFGATPPVAPLPETGEGLLCKVVLDHPWHQMHY